MMGFIILYITHAHLDDAKKVASHLIEKKLIACANFFPVESLYRWKGKVEETKEVVSLIKTKKEHWTAVKEEVKKIHSYEVPCIMKIEVEANEEYEDWIGSETL